MADTPQTGSAGLHGLAAVELVGIGLGAAMGLVAAGPLIWLASHAWGAVSPELIPAVQFAPWELILIWLGSALAGGYLAVAMTRAVLSNHGARPFSWLRHASHLLGGCAVIALLAALPAALILGLFTGGPRAIGLYYTIAGPLVGWQSGCITFVFLYTFTLLERIRRAQDEEGASRSSSL